MSWTVCNEGEYPFSGRLFVSKSDFQTIWNPMASFIQNPRIFLTCRGRKQEDFSNHILSPIGHTSPPIEREVRSNSSAKSWLPSFSIWSLSRDFVMVILTIQAIISGGEDWQPSEYMAWFWGLNVCLSSYESQDYSVMSFRSPRLPYQVHSVSSSYLR